MPTQILVVAGFLGSGKTSLILGLGRWFAREQPEAGWGSAGTPPSGDALKKHGWSVAVIENEINAGGVDGTVLTRSGLAVRELAAGCVCCSLRTDLATTLRAIHDELHPDLVIIEPSGVAGPGTVIEAVAGVIPNLAPPRVLGVIDATRLPTLMEINPFLVESLLDVASVVALTKCDLVDSERVDACRTTLAGFAASPPVLAVDNRNDGHIRALIDALDAPDRSASTAPGAGGGHAIAAATVARQWTWSLFLPEDQASWRDRLQALLMALAADQPGSHGLVGHLKLVATTDDGGWLAGGITRLDTGVRWSGDGWHGSARSVQVTLNAIVMGQTSAALATAIDQRVAVCCRRHALGVQPR